jgi:hypothetical protein
MLVVASISVIQGLGAGCFGALIGWFTYYVNRYRAEGVKLMDIMTLIGAIGGVAVLTLFPEKTDLFGAYGIGLAVGFFGYFVVLLLMVKASPDFTLAWLLDGRRPPLREGEQPLPAGHRPPMEAPADHSPITPT